ncbi:MAG: carboxypeptidase regulatory-like domain-containing protein [Mangrovibacterium sp.]
MKTALILLSLLISTQTFTAGAQKTKNITGRIVDSETMKPISDVSVTLAEGSFVLGTLSNENGDFRLWKVPEKCQKVVVSHQGYEPQTVSITALKDSPGNNALLIKLHVTEPPRKQISSNERFDKPKR